jgi:hypothetical protein
MRSITDEMYVMSSLNAPSPAPGIPDVAPIRRACALEMLAPPRYEAGAAKGKVGSSMRDRPRGRSENSREAIAHPLLANALKHARAIVTRPNQWHYVNQLDHPGEGLSLLALSTKQASYSGRVIWDRRSPRRVTERGRMVFTGWPPGDGCRMCVLSGRRSPKPAFFRHGLRMSGSRIIVIIWIRSHQVPMWASQAMDSIVSGHSGVKTVHDALW